MPELASLTGRLLVAAPTLTDPNFTRSVVLVLDHDEDGALGVVLNRPTEVEVADVLEPWARYAGGPSVVFSGGPVARDSALALGSIPGLVAEDDVPAPAAGAGLEGAPTAPTAPDEPLGWRRVHGALGLIDLDTPPELLAPELGALRVFAGYAGWAPGQLEEELAENAWFPIDSEPGDPFSPRPAALWRAVLRRQRSELALLATYPDDPAMN